MTVLSKEKIEIIALGLDRVLMKKPDHILLKDFKDCLDTIADRDKQIDDLRAKVRELEAKLKVATKAAWIEKADHEPGCFYDTDPFMNHPCTCGAVKEPEVKDA